MNKEKVWWLWGMILVVAIILRTYKLGELPYGFHVDEAKAGWNAWSILKTGKDDRGNILAAYYDSFGDYRPTGIFYVIIPALIVLGRSVLAVRLMPALIGALTIWPLGLLIKELAEKNKIGLALTGMALLAINPWHIDVSRSTSEGLVCGFLILWGTYFFIRIIKYHQWRDVVGCLFFIATSYTMATIRVLGPIMIVISAGFFYQQITNNKSQFKVAVTVGGIIIIALGTMMHKEARGRLTQVSVLNDYKAGIELQSMPAQEGPNRILIARVFHNKVVVYGKEVISEYLNYFSSGFLTGDMAKPLRYRINGFGLITMAELILIGAGLVALGRKKEVGWWWVMLLLAPIPAAITIEDTPNMHRALLMVPFLIGIEAYGLELIWGIKRWGRILMVMFIGAWGLNWIYFGHMYFEHSKYGIASYYRDGGNVELAQEVYQRQNNYDLIYLSSYPDDLYPWIALLNNKDSQSFNQAAASRDNGDWRFENMIFRKQHCASESMIRDGFPTGKLLIVDAEGCQIAESTAKKLGLTLIKTITRPDGSPPYYLWEKSLAVAAK